MKKVSLASLAISAAFLISPVVLAGQCAPGDTCYTFDFSAGPVQITNGLLTVAPTPAVDEGGGVTSYNIVGFSGNYTDSMSPVNGAISLFPGNGSLSNMLTIPGWEYDNEFYPGANAPGTTGGLFDVGGLMFYVGTVDSSAYFVNIWAGNIYGEPGSPGTYTIYEGQLGGGTYTLVTGEAISGEVVPPPVVNPPSQNPVANLILVPESGALSMLILCALGLAGGFLLRLRQSGLCMNR